MSFLPGLVLFNGTANLFTRALGVPAASEVDTSQTEAELRTAASQSQAEGHIDTDELNMIEGVFDLEETIARQIMVPRPDVEAVDTETPLSALYEIATAGHHMRYPVIKQGDGEHPIGFVHVQDLLRIEIDRRGDSTRRARTDRRRSRSRHPDRPGGQTHRRRVHRLPA
ncbi:CBS domain-containing protein [Halococcus thailandensis]|uniref:CBS domain-containing protein n=1 Tax=Halococcus thailandensis JCM 13552 TaxID=1227457 RepID=M0N916_9EURY|nr:CBS domain-containing protein [Halococcus thailandensis]EMA54452.1 hypothetical protein C451_06495 [Halococcus thailandensis JCM 13552]